ncbi:hypothetical protein Tco_1066033 [Tanacetum coccineum]
MQSSSVSSDFASKFLNLDNVPPVDNEVASMMNDKVSHEESSTQAPLLLTVPVTAIPVTSNVATTTVPLTITPITSIPQLSTPTPIPTTEPTTSSIHALPDFASLFGFDQRKSKSYRTAEQHKDLYDALVKSYQLNKDLFDFYGKTYSLKRGREDKDKDKDPPARSDQGLKKRKTSKDDEPPKGSKLKESKSSLSKGAKSQLKTSGKSVQAEEPMFETADTKMIQDQGGDLGNTEDQPNVEEASKHYWFKKTERPPTLDPDWNAGKQIDFRPPQTWISKIAKSGKPPLTFDELMSTPIDFLAYVMHNLKIDNLTQQHLTLPLVEDRGRQVVPANYFFNNDLEYLKGGSSSRKYTTSTTKTKAAKYDNIKGIEDMVLIHAASLSPKKISNLERDYLFNLVVALRMFTRRIVILHHVEDLQLGVISYQKKLNITKPETCRSDISKRTPYTEYNNSQGVIYLDKFKRNMLMNSDELYKFYDGTISFVHIVLHDIASNLRMDYLPKRKWCNLDRQRSCIMIKAINKLRFERRLMRNLEKFVGGRYYETDLRLLERII